MQMAEKLSITLPAEMAKAVREKVSAGFYASNSEIIREALRGWLDNEKKLQALDKDIAEGIADIEAGRVRPLDDVCRELDIFFQNGMK